MSLTVEQSRPYCCQLALLTATLLTLPVATTHKTLCYSYPVALEANVQCFTSQCRCSSTGVLLNNYLNMQPGCGGLGIFGML